MLPDSCASEEDGDERLAPDGSPPKIKTFTFEEAENDYEAILQRETGLLLGLVECKCRRVREEPTSPERNDAGMMEATAVEVAPIGDEAGEFDKLSFAIMDSIGCYPEDFFCEEDTLEYYEQPLCERGR